MANLLLLAVKVKAPVAVLNVVTEAVAQSIAADPAGLDVLVQV